MELVNEWFKEYEKLQARIKRLEDALRFYAQMNKSYFEPDDGLLARKALEKTDGQP